MHTTSIDYSALPITLAVIGVAALILLALRTIHRMFPQIAEKIKDATPWLGWVEIEDETESVPTYITHAFHRPESLNRW